MRKDRPSRDLNAARPCSVALLIKTSQPKQKSENLRSVGSFASMEIFESVQGIRGATKMQVAAICFLIEKDVAKKSGGI